MFPINAQAVWKFKKRGWGTDTVLAWELGVRGGLGLDPGWQGWSAI